MLVLSRKSGQSIRVGDDIVITVVSVNGKRAKIGIEAPGYCRIMREEILTDEELAWSEEKVGEEFHLTAS